MEHIIERAKLLIDHGRYAEADSVLKDLLRSDADDAQVLALLAEANLQLDKISQAEVFINNAIGVSPGTAYLYWIRARIVLGNDDYASAENDVKQAIELDPQDADYFSLYAAIQLDRKMYEEALELANNALQLDPEHVRALNIRSTALLKLNRKEESFNTIEGALREDPNNSHTHSNYGWGLLEKGNHKKALEHFREALKNDPGNEYAKSGMVEALKAGNIIYRWFLQYSFWMSNLSQKYQWGVIIAFYFGMKILRGIAKSNEALQPYLIPLIVLLAVVAFSTWIITPVSNLFLRLNKYGKHLLDKQEMMSSNFVGISVLVFAAGLISYFIMNDDRYITVALFGFIMMLPLGVMFSPARSKYALVIYAIAMTAIGIAAVAATFVTGEIFTVCAGIFILGFIAFQWIANYMLIKENNV